MRVAHANSPGYDLRDLPRRVAQLKNVTSETFNGEVLVQRADEGVFRLQQDAVIGHFRDRAAGRERQQPRAAPSAQDTVHFIPMDERGTTAAWRGKSVRDHRDDRIEVAPNEFAIGPCPRDQFVEIVLGTGAARRLRRDLLSQDVERRVVRHDGVEVAAAGCPQQRRAFHEVVQRDR
jgi:hypothetical protein